MISGASAAVNALVAAHLDPHEARRPDGEHEVLARRELQLAGRDRRAVAPHRVLLHQPGGIALRFREAGIY